MNSWCRNERIQAYVQEDLIESMNTYTWTQVKDITRILHVCMNNVTLEIEFCMATHLREKCNYLVDVKLVCPSHPTSSKNQWDILYMSI